MKTKILIAFIALAAMAWAQSNTLQTNGAGVLITNTGKTPSATIPSGATWTIASGGNLAVAGGGLLTLSGNVSANGVTISPIEFSYLDGAQDFGGSVLKLSAPNGKTIYVSKGGSATNTRTGVSKYDQNRPFATITAALATAASGDLIVVGPGVYEEMVEVTTAGISMHFDEGAQVLVDSTIYDSVGAADKAYALSVTESASGFYLSGRGEFVVDVDFVGSNYGQTWGAVQFWDSSGSQRLHFEAKRVVFNAGTGTRPAVYCERPGVIRVDEVVSDMYDCFLTLNGELSIYCGRAYAGDNISEGSVGYLEVGYAETTQSFSLGCFQVFSGTAKIGYFQPHASAMTLGGVLVGLPTSIEVAASPAGVSLPSYQNGPGAEIAVVRLMSGGVVKMMGTSEWNGVSINGIATGTGDGAGKILVTDSEGKIPLNTIPAGTLQFRRGSDEDRQGITFASGEPVWTTDTKKLFVGDGTTVGAIPVLPEWLVEGESGVGINTSAASLLFSDDGLVTLSPYLGFTVETAGNIVLSSAVGGNSILIDETGVGMTVAGIDGLGITTSSASVNASDSITLTSETSVTLSHVGSTSSVGVEGGGVFIWAQDADDAVQLVGDSVQINSLLGSVTVNGGTPTTEAKGLWLGDDTAIYRSAANFLSTSDSFVSTAIGATGGVAGFSSVSTAPRFRFFESDGSTNAKAWDIAVGTDTFLFRNLNDSDASPVNWLSVTRSGTNPGTATFTAKIQGTANATTAGVNVGSVASVDPTSLSNGDLWVRGTTMFMRTVGATMQVTGDVNTQTFQNKTINLSNNTLTATSAQMRTALSDETGTGAAVFATSPTLVAPILTGYTVATLPAGTVGMVAYVTDALAPTWRAAVVGGGSEVVEVFYNGTNWLCH